MTTVKPAHRLTLRDKLSRLTFDQACQLLGPDGKKMILRGSRREIDFREHVRLGGESLKVRFITPRHTLEAVTTLTLADDARHRLRWHCTTCDDACEHVGAMFSFVLEEKSLLGLAVPPPEVEGGPLGGEHQVIEAALADRRERAKVERMKVRPADRSTPWSDYEVESLVSGKSYRVALRGLSPGESFCSCPDFRTNTLGVCKHLFKVMALVRKKFEPRQLRRPYKHRRVEVHLHYAPEVTLRVAAPERLSPEVAALLKSFVGRPVDDIRGLLKRLQRLTSLGQEYHVFPDAEEFIQQRLHVGRLESLVAEIRRDPAGHPLRKSLLKIDLLPYQLDGVAFAAGAGRAVLADDMGLGKTIQAVGTAELLARQADVRKVLIVCPASLKSQWRNEIQRFCQRNVQLVGGANAQRTTQYQNESFFTVCNYEQVLKDIMSIEQIAWDLIVLDEGQRIKNWEAKTTRVIKGLKSRFALVLSGTPLENRLEELYSVVQFVDDRRLGPGFRFFHRHRLVDDKGKVVGYKQLESLRQRLRPILLRRTRESVRLELPPRTTEIIRIPPTAEQKALHDEHMRVVAQIVGKKFLTEMDLIRLRIALLMCRMSANGTILVTKEKPNWSTKLERIDALFEELAREPSRKTVLFSEWTTMLDQIQPVLKKHKLTFVRLDGKVPQKKRQALVHEFQHDPNCKVFLTTNAGSTGLNLQAADTVVNVDLPWNPAVLEQRIARAHRMGQTRPVQVYLLVTEQTIEESLLTTLAAKKDLALAALDTDSEVDTVEMSSNTNDLKARLEVLLGAAPFGLVDKSQQADTVKAIEDNHRQRVAAAGGELLGAAFQFLGQLVEAQPGAAAAPQPLVEQVFSGLARFTEIDSDGRPRLMLSLPNQDALKGLAETLARLLVATGAESAPAESTGPTANVGRQSRLPMVVRV